MDLIVLAVHYERSSNITSQSHYKPDSEIHLVLIIAPFSVSNLNSLIGDYSYLVLDNIPVP